jgi:[ribosomal protein S5]-alanine N-acetyltransferase
VEERASGALIGFVGFAYHHDDWTTGPHKTEIGWRLDRSFWDRGLATEGAATAASPYGFEGLGLERVISIIQPANLASRRVAEARGETRWRGHAVVWHAIDRSEWLGGPEAWKI